MATFPASPLPARELLEDWLPKAFAEAGPPPGAEEVDVRLGIRLEGEGGGEWVLHLDHGQLRVIPGSRQETAFTYLQSVEDWRGALWEGRGAAIGDGAAQLFKPGAPAAAAAAAPTGGTLGGAPSASALQQMEKLSGVIKMVVTGEDGEDWSVAFKLGPGEIPAEPTTTITLTAADAAALQSGELDPMTAFMSGRMQVTGDMTLMMQMQAIQMQAQAAAASTGGPAGGSGSGESS